MRDDVVVGFPLRYEFNVSLYLMVFSYGRDSGTLGDSGHIVSGHFQTRCPRNGRWNVIEWGFRSLLLTFQILLDGPGRIS
jgi:hypothetical protein